MPRINQKLPISLATAITQANTPYERADFAANYAIGTTPWIAATSDKYEYNRVTTAYQRERVDQESSAGENSLSNWWLRSATSWHRGEGVTFYDADQTDLYRFRSSWNVDVWTEGQLSLLPATELVYDDEVTYLTNSQNGVFFIADAGTVHFFNGTTATHLTTVATHGTATCLATDGFSAYVGTTKGVYKVTEGGTVTKLYHAGSTSDTWTAHTIGFVKERLVIGVTHTAKHYVFELSVSPAAPPQSITLTDNIYESDATSLVFNSITETNASILVGYTIGQVSRVIAFTIDSTSTNAFGLPSLSSAITVAKLPTGETLNVIREYLNTYIILGTSKGLRVGVDTGSIGFSYGPLTIDSEVKDITFYGGYVYATRSVDHAADGSDSKGLWRIDLGESTNAIYAHASDLTVDSGTPATVTILGNTGKLIIGTETGLHLESDSLLATSGYLTSGRIRYGTNENKQPVSLSTNISGDGGSYGIVVETSSGQRVEYPVLTVLSANNFNLASSLIPDEWFEITLNLYKGSSVGVPDESPVFDQWQLRSLPAPARSRTITLSVLCYDEEKDMFGQVKVESAYSRLRTLERLENSGTAVLFQDFTTDEQRSCVIRAVQFAQTTPPSAEDGFGGIVTIQLQTIDAE